jgi:hypothetical protein
MPIGPTDWMLRIIGIMFAAKRSASALWDLPPHLACLSDVGRIAQHGTLGLFRRERRLGAL